jgi:hypothetical protein
MTSYPQTTWWSLALSEEVTARKPLSVDIGDQPIVMWRDTAGVARAGGPVPASSRAPVARLRARQRLDPVRLSRLEL